MLKLTWAELNKETFVKALVKLNHCDKLDEKTAYRVGRLVLEAGREMDKARREESKICAEYAEKNDAGVVLTEPSGLPKWKNADGAKSFSLAFEKLLKETSVEFKVHKLQFEALQHAGLTGAELVALEHIIEGIPEVA